MHKWMYGPRGTGFLFVKRSKIERIWPLLASWSNKPAHSIEKFEEVGTVFKALPASIPEAIAFNRQIGQESKSARLTYLRSRWAIPLRQHPRIRLLTDIEAEPGTGFGAFDIEGMDNGLFERNLLEEFGISVRAFEMEEDRSMAGIHLSPGLANTVEEIERFVEATLTIINRSDC
jgi:selenocysteine lyase/cysteine desulfurase